MATVEIEKLINQLKPKYLQELVNYLDYLLFVQQKQSGANGRAEKKPAAEVKPQAEKQVEEDISERLRIARQYAGDAPYPHFPTSKYDVYEQ
ncbi:MAG: hypothetical protein IPM82_16275 [Saprospiraceae bacterium]|nr:hypothetical protein [Saprospiraceae bacterium]